MEIPGVEFAVGVAVKGLFMGIGFGWSMAVIVHIFAWVVAISNLGFKD